ncbi:hypothetical protein FNY88_06290 [Corynebacterium guaraldiae]|uniref:Secreted protein n=2 Tax=Corynebacterium guaraldiae TaxID=3051103 RepID=A0ABY3CU64_9CORY|nr:hypothetical protein [Corynebacterium guaraldiae]TRX49164.1 hypothetical protein FNY88_06290 [Corynebacterium guaraldiae]TRX52871.1 hypothetical protein FNY91_05195 [Corynebacterium guaraldiae]
MWRMRNKLVLCSVAAAIGLSAPTASADMVDDYLAKVPAGQISCEQATKYYTNPSDYNSKKSQALAAANFHPRGPEIRDAVARADEAIARCGLNGGGGNAAPAQNTAPANNTVPANNGGGAPANNGNNAPSNNAFPTFPVTIGNFTFNVPDILAYLKTLVEGTPLAQLLQ